MPLIRESLHLDRTTLHNPCTSEFAGPSALRRVRSQAHYFASSNYPNGGTYTPFYPPPRGPWRGQPLLRAFLELSLSVPLAWVDGRQALLGRIGALLGASWAVLGLSGGVSWAVLGGLGVSWGLLGSPGDDLGLVWVVGSPPGPPRGLARTTKNNKILDVPLQKT